MNGVQNIDGGREVPKSYFPKLLWPPGTLLSFSILHDYNCPLLIHSQLSAFQLKHYAVLDAVLEHSLCFLERSIDKFGGSIFWETQPVHNTNFQIIAASLWSGIKPSS